MIVVVTGLPAAGKTTLARALARELRLPVFSLDAIKEALYDAPGAADRTGGELRFAAEAVLTGLLVDAPSGAVVDIWLDPTREDRARLRAGLPPGRAACEVFCDVTAETATSRYARRDRHRLHRTVDAELRRRIDEAAELMTDGERSAPAGLGPVLRADTSGDVDVTMVAAWVRGLAVNGS